VAAARAQVRGELPERLLVVVRVDAARQHETDGNPLRSVLRRGASVPPPQLYALVEARAHEPLEPRERVRVGRAYQVKGLGFRF
jgi:hypothetical protein